MRVKLLRLAVRLWELWAAIVHPVQLGVRIILVQDGKVLLVRHTYMEGWHFPGGGMNRWETPLEAAAREAKEEAGVELMEPPSLVGIFTSYWGGKSDHVAVYLCRKYRVGQATDRWEIAECKFFALDALPLQLGERWHKLLQELSEAAYQTGKIEWQG
jgi:ADP-ribose pyrophosphatase YjhB (NUDIX family)